MRASFKFLLFFIVNISLAFASYHFLKKSDLFVVQHVKVEVEKDSLPDPAFLSKAFTGLEAQAKSDLDFYIGKNILDIDLHEAVSKVQMESWVEKVQIRRSYPSELVVEIVPKKWVALAVSKSGAFLPVTEDGTLLPEMQSNTIPALPILNSQIATQEGLRKKAVTILNHLPIKGLFSHESIAEVGAESSAFLFTLLGSKSVVKIREENLGVEVARVEKVLEYLDAHKLQGRVIDADYSKKVVVKLRNHR